MPYSFTAERVTTGFAATNEARDVTSSGATVYGSVTDGGQVAAGGGVPTYFFEYSTDPTFGSGVNTQSAIIGSDGSASAVLFGLSGSTEYYYRVAVTNVRGTAYGVGRSFTTSLNPPTLIAPTGLTAGLGPPPGPITFVWQYNSGGAAGGQTAYSLRLTGTVPTLGAGTWYWDGSGWTATQTWIASPEQAVTIAASFFEINGQYTWSCATADANGDSDYA
ncbi:MAG TPA: hypothetical protein VMV09_02075 [Candidatus Saccharimonadales bacterium]|nr:hypothetical protein [Candidatus Saccharimonadales bacterium]